MSVSLRNILLWTSGALPAVGRSFCSVNHRNCDRDMVPQLTEVITPLQFGLIASAWEMAGQNTRSRTRKW